MLRASAAIAARSGFPSSRVIAYQLYVSTNVSTLEVGLSWFIGLPSFAKSPNESAPGDPGPP